MLIRFLGLFFIVVAITGASCAKSSLSLNHQGLQRDFIVHLPADYQKGRSYPLVMVFHGGGGNAKGMEETSGFDRVADNNGFIVVYPNGTGKKKNKMLTFNAGNCCGYAQEKNIDDVGFSAKLIDYMVSNYAVDPRRVYAAGHSNGAMLAYRLACELPNKIRAIAAVGGQGAAPSCSGARGVSVLAIHGTDDRCQRYNGGSCGGCMEEFYAGLGIKLEKKYNACTSMPSYMDTVAQAHQCRSGPNPGYRRGRVSCEAWRDCSGGSRVTFCSMQGAGHDWPGGAGPKFCQRRPNGKLCKKWMEALGQTANDVNGSALIWQFFKQVN